MKNALMNRMTSPLSTKAQSSLVELKSALRSFHQSERGDNENLGRMLVLALILVPIVIVLTVFGTEIVAESKSGWDVVTGSAVTP